MMWRLWYCAAIIGERFNHTRIGAVIEDRARVRLYPDESAT